MRNAGLALFFATLLLGCKTRSRENSLAPSTEGLNSDLLLTADEIRERPKVSSFLIDSGDFRVNGVRINLQSYLFFETPVIAFELPQLADYVEILRCPHDAIIYGGESAIEGIEFKTPSIEEETAIFKSNNFWQAALTMGRCTIAATSYRDVTFEDSFAPTGRWIYYLRACVDTARLKKNKGVSTYCSRQMTSTREINFTNRRNSREIKALAKAQSLRNQIDSISMEIVDLTEELQKKLFQCQNKYQTQVTSFEEKEAMGTIVGLGVGAGLGAASLGGYAVRRSLKHRNSTLKSSKINTAGGVIGTISLLGSAAYISSLIYKVAEDPPQGFPIDPIQCYRGDLKELVDQLADETISGKELCQCAHAIKIKQKLKILGDEMKYLIRLRDVQIIEGTHKNQQLQSPEASNRDATDG